MKELTSHYDDLEKRLAIFFGLGALVLSALVGLMRGIGLMGILLNGVLALGLATLAAWIFGAWLKGVLRAGKPSEETAPGVERRSVTPATLEEGTVVTPQPDKAIVADEVHEPLAPNMGSLVLPELNPVEQAALQAIVDGAGQEAPTDAAPAPAPAKA